MNTRSASVSASETRERGEVAAGRGLASAAGVGTKAWVRALALTAPIASHPERTFPGVIDERAAVAGDTAALLSDREQLTYRALARRSNAYARWALGQGLAKGDTVCLLMPNRPEYLAIWLGLTRVGVVVSLLNTNLRGPALAGCIDLVEPAQIVVAAELADALAGALRHLPSVPRIWVHGPSQSDFPRIDCEIDREAGEGLSAAERRPLTIDDRALYIYTSGTTGLPKAACVSHARLMQWSHWFAGMMDTSPSDRMYNCLPMYHSIGGVVATGAALVGGASVVIRERFSVRHFWEEVVRWDCTLFQYIGELCRYLLQGEASPHETRHRLRMCCGNGLREDVWREFQRRFRIPRILEFYAATEGSVSLFNTDAKPGAIGRIPPFLAHRFPVALVSVDAERGEPIRDDRGFCIRSGPNQAGEALGRIVEDSSNVGSRFEGYRSAGATEKKILRHVFEPGDAWFRTGDLMRKDAHGHFYFVDRLGDTFRWKGENVASSEVAEAIRAFPGVKDADVYGVSVPGTEGRAPMAALVSDGALDLAAFRAHLIDRLPRYARPLFLSLKDAMELTATFKYARTCARGPYDPASTADQVYFNDPERQAFVRLDNALYERIQDGGIRL